jgi:predicted dehydrogenase
MTVRKKLHIAVVGLGFGFDFVPLYLHHPDVERVTVSDSNPALLKRVADQFGVSRRAANLTDILNDDDIDAVHLLTPVPLHVEHTVAVLKSGKHCACAVPMASTIEGIRTVIDAWRASSKVYMGMETAVYGNRFLYVQDMRDRGDLGAIQFLSGAYFQDTENYAKYWNGTPPMTYVTHITAPLLALPQTRARSVYCLGSGVMRAELVKNYGNPFPIETAIFDLESPTPLVAQINRTMFHTARTYQETFNVYGELASFEWEQVEGEDPLLHRWIAIAAPGSDRHGSEISQARLPVPDYGARVPPEIARFTRYGYYDEAHPETSFKLGGGHDGAHPHMAHEFVRSIIEGRQPSLDAITTANWNAPGICAHESALQGGAQVLIPQFDK